MISEVKYFHSPEKAYTYDTYSINMITKSDLVLLHIVKWNMLTVFRLRIQQTVPMNTFRHFLIGA